MNHNDAPTLRRLCSRPGCGKKATSTLTYAYAEQTAVVGPLIEENNPHSWDLCEDHTARVTVPHGWELVRVGRVELGEDDDLFDLAEAVGISLHEGRVTEELGSAGQDPIDYRPTFDGADPDTSNHPVFRMRRVEDVRAARRSHLSVVSEGDSEDNED